MLESPAIQDQEIIAFVQAEYNLRIASMEFLPLGADAGTAVYRLESVDGAAWFLKLRKGVFHEISVTLPAYLKTQCNRAVIEPLLTKAGRLWADFSEYKMILYPFVQCIDGYETALAEQHWLEFGAAVKENHAAQLPIELSSLIRCEDFSPHWREMVVDFQEQARSASFNDPTAASLANFMQQKQAEITRLVETAGRLAQALQSLPLELVLCHSDLHPGNLLITDSGELYIVDWDAPILAPREHDLMHIGGSKRWSDPLQAEIFYEGYGPVDIDHQALAYYRCERIIQDIAAFCQQLFLTNDGGPDRIQALEYFTGQFLPGHEVEIAISRPGR